jgi:hypothetical protein
MKTIRADKRKYHYIYKITRFDGKYYIGMHSTDDLEDGYFGSGKLISRSMKKYGAEKHSKEILEFLDSRISLKTRERELVNEEILDDPLCMNLKLGGDGGWDASIARKNWQNPEYAAKISKAVSAINRKRYEDPAARQKLSEIMKLERAKDLSRFKPKKDWTGLKHTEETKLKMRNSHKGLQDGEKNSQFGSCWVTDGVKPIKIKKDKLSEYLENGYSRGRKTTLINLAKIASFSREF